MRNLVSTYVEQFRQDRQKQLKLVAVLAALAVIVAGLVFWQLHNTGVAMTNEVFCGQEEHIHNADCYDEDGTTLLCMIPEHTHTVECLTDETADVETAGDWEATLPGELSGIWSEDVTAVAESQVGYTESEQNFQLAEDGVTRQGYTRYGAWYGNDYGDWDAMFVSFCLNYAGVPEDEVPESSGAYALAVAMTDMGTCVFDDGFVPEAGDLVFFDTDADQAIDSVGIVKDLIADDTEITGIAVIEGNSNDAVEETEYDLNDPMIIAYGILPDQPDVDNIEAPADESGFDCRTLNLWIHDADGNVIGSYDEEEGLPCDALICTDPDTDEEYVLIPVSCFEEALADAEYEFDDSEDCPIYCDINDADADDTEDALKACSYDSVTVDGETNWYVRVSDSEEETADRLDVYYIEPYAWTGTASGKVVLNLGNGNGEYNFADYAGNKNAGTALRYTTDSLADYADDDGNVTIKLPSDGDLADTADDKDATKNFTVVDATSGLSAVTVALGNAQAYDYKLVGWVNIATGEYYDVSDGATTADIDLDNENVFYADWIAATYDNASSTDENAKDLKETVSTSGFVTMHMYDYNELYNLYSESLVQNGTDSEKWTDSGNLYNALPYPSGQRLTSSFIFVNDGTTEKSKNDKGETDGMLSWPSDKKTGNNWTGSGQPPRDATEIWGIESPYSAPMNMLYGQSSNPVGVHYVGDADYLFWVDENGYYTYNSKEAAAVYNQREGRFYVYDEPLYVVGTEFSCFLPFNEFAETSKGSDGNPNESPYNVNDGTVDYWFGMDMEVDFYLPDDTGTEGGNQTLDGKDMVFNFSGDDDILIFIDDELALDMSGIHDESFGSFNFAKGTVTMGMSTDSEGNITDGTTTEFSLSAGSHDLKIYYMERGGYASNLEIQFNVVSLWEYMTGDVQTVTAEKTWKDAQGNVIDPEDLPAVFKNNGVEVGLFDVLGPATEDTFGYTKEDDVYTVEYTDDSGVFRSYVYDNSGETPTLTYTEVARDGTVIVDNVTYNDVDSEGRVVDNDGYVIAWLDGENLHIRIDKQTLNDANGWYYAWELLDAEGDYEVLELTSSSSYTRSSTTENLTRYYYWSIIGDNEIENSFKAEGDPLQIILTEAAQETDSTLGNTKDAMGWVIVATDSGITTQQAEFSQRAELHQMQDKATGLTTYLTIAGVTSQSEIDKLGSGAIWYVEDAEAQTEDITGNYLEDFHLYCVLDGTTYYLTLVEDSTQEGGYTLTVTSDSSAAGTFCYDSLGELLVVLSEDNVERVEIQKDGTISIDLPEDVAATDDIRIYTLQLTETSGFAFTAVNTFLPNNITIEKVDSITGEALAGVQFTLQNEEGLYYVYDPDEGEDTWTEEVATVVTGADGTYVFHYLPDGTYTLTETKALDGYNMLPSAIKFTIETTEEGVVINCDPADFFTFDASTFTFTIENDAGYELPVTGGTGTWIYTVIGVCLIGGTAVTLVYRKRRAVRS